MGKSAPSPPPAPDPVQTSNAQTTSNIDTAVAQGLMDRVNQYTPYGNLIYQQTGTQSVDGHDVPTFQAIQQLTPAQQAALNSQQSLTQSLYDLAQGQTGRIASTLATPFTTDGIAAIPTDPSAFDKGVSDQYYKMERGYLDPLQEQQRTQLQDQLVHQGIQPGNAAYDTETGNLQRSQGQQDQAAITDALTTGSNVAGQQFGQTMQANQAGLQEKAYLYNQPLNEATALMSGGQIQNPTFTNTPQVSVAPTDVLGAYGLTQSALNTGYQGQVAAANSGNSAAAGLGGTALMAGAVFF